MPLARPFPDLLPEPPAAPPGRAAALAQGARLDALRAHGQAAPGQLLQGLRGSGKSALLQALQAQSQGSGALVTTVRAQAGRPLARLLYPALRQLLYALPQRPAAALTLLSGFRNAHAPGLGAPADDPAPVPGLGDSGDLEADLGAILGAAASAARAQGVSLAVGLDEAHCLPMAGLSALLRAQAAAGPGLSLRLAGLPWLDRLSAADHALAQRRYALTDLLPLERADGDAALQAAAQAVGGRWKADALDELWRVSKGHPALLQAWASATWALAGSASPDAAAVRRAEPAATAALDATLYGPGFERLQPRERSYLRSMAHLGAGPHRSGDIADSMDAKITALGPLRARLMEAGWVHSPAHGLLGFTAPGMDEYMRRVMPNFR